MAVYNTISLATIYGFSQTILLTGSSNTSMASTPLATMTNVRFNFKYPSQFTISYTSIGVYNQYASNGVNINICASNSLSAYNVNGFTPNLLEGVVQLVQLQKITHRLVVIK